MLGRIAASSSRTTVALFGKPINAVFSRSFYKMPEIPYQTKGLVPFISAKSLQAHIEQHKTDVERANNLLENTPYKDMPITHTLRSTNMDSDDAAFFNSTSSHFNHSFFWKCLSDQVYKPSMFMNKAFRLDFGSYEDFQVKFSQNASSLSTPGFTWLVFRDKSLQIINTFGYGSPYELENTYPLLCLDLHEHAYFLDYQTNRYKYIANFWNFVNWEFVEEKFKLALVYDRDYRMNIEQMVAEETQKEERNAQN
eukprot:gene16176-19253_t